MPRRSDGNLRAFFEPASIAAIGSLREMVGTAYWLIRNLRAFGYSGRIYPINPEPSKYREVFGSPVFASVADVTETIDLAVVIAPPAAVPEIVRQCADKGVPAVIVLSEGFAESGVRGAELQRQLTEMARETGTRIMGPNTFGVLNAANGLATIAPFLERERVESGGVALCSQTGSTGPHQMPLGDWGYPISKMCDIGNKCDVDEVDVLDYLAHDQETRVVAMHLEDVRDGRRFMEAARRFVARKPLVVLKTGRTQAGARASASHTGSLLGSDRVYDAAFRQVGAIRVATWQQFWEVPKALLREPLPQGKRFAVITITGGQGVIAADAADRAGLEVASFSAATASRLSAISPRLGGNPVDLGPAMSDSRSQSAGNPFAIVEGVTSIVLEDGNVDCATVTLCVTQQLVPLFPMVVDMLDGLARRSQKALNVWVYGTSLPAVEEVARQLQLRGVPAHFDLDVAIQSLACAARYPGIRAARVEEIAAASTARPGIASDTISRARRDGRTILTEVDAKLLVGEAGIPVVETSLATTGAQAVAISEKLGFPVVLKIASPDVVHKSDAGGVRVGLTSAAQVERAYSEIMAATKRAYPEARLDGVAVEKMMKPGIELILGMSRDPQFGPTILFGLGGVFTEVLDDVAFRITPLDARNAREMIREIKGFPLLQGHRGGEPADLAALEEMLIRVSELVDATPEIAELDLNPVLAYGDRAVVVDARVILESRPRAG